MMRGQKGVRLPSVSRRDGWQHWVSEAKQTVIVGRGCSGRVARRTTEVKRDGRRPPFGDERCNRCNGSWERGFEDLSETLFDN